jgi:hypothetical protein
MKKLFYLLFGFAVLACSPKIIDGGDAGLGNIMANDINKKVSMAQFDSICIADTLPNKLSEWKFLGLIDYESNQRTSLFMYMKRSGKTESVYRVEETMDDSVKIIKRVIVE